MCLSPRSFPLPAGSAGPGNVHAAPAAVTCVMSSTQTGASNAPSSETVKRQEHKTLV